MDAGVIVAIVIAALIVLALLVWLGRRGRERRLDTRRDEARQIRREAEVSRAQADRTRAEAEERAARARREEATAREQAAHAEERQREARDRHMEAASVDPDVDEREAAERYDRGEAGAGGITSHGHGEDNGAVEHHEETRTPDDERERHLVRDEDGNVVRDEESHHPRA
jgi:FtsZ-interacting cell division protein ZipA